MAPRRACAANGNASTKAGTSRIDVRCQDARGPSAALMDGPGATDLAGKKLFSCAHPRFWAPFTILGDGGGE